MSIIWKQIRCKRVFKKSIVLFNILLNIFFNFHFFCVICCKIKYFNKKRVVDFVLIRKEKENYETLVYYALISYGKEKNEN